MKSCPDCGAQAAEFSSVWNGQPVMPHWKCLECGAGWWRGNHDPDLNPGYVTEVLDVPVISFEEYRDIMGQRALDEVLEVVNAPISLTDPRRE